MTSCRDESIQRTVRTALFLSCSYIGNINNETQLEATLESDRKSNEFLPYAQLIAWLTQELNGFYAIGDYVHTIDCRQFGRAVVTSTKSIGYVSLVVVLAADDLSNFSLELGGFLRDYGCPYRTLLDNDTRLIDRSSRLQLLG
jgi:hypothetical protein